MSLKDKEPFMLVLLFGLLAFSLYSSYYFMQIPVVLNHYVPTCSYMQEADYLCLVTVKPNVIYDNKTLLTPDYIIYSSLSEKIDVSFQYSFSVNPLSTDPPQIKYGVQAFLKGDSWSKNFTLTNSTIIEDSSVSESYSLNLTEVNSLIDEIEEETLEYSAEYIYEIVPHIEVACNSSAGLIQEEYDPTLSITLSRNKIDFSGLINSESGSLGDYLNSLATWPVLGISIRNMQYTSFIGSGFFSLGMIYLAWRLMNKPPSPLIETIRKKYREKIVESKPTKLGSRKVLIEVKSMEDLDKISEETIKPILHHEETITEGVKRYKFQVLDSDVVYEYKLEEKKEVNS